MNHKDIIVEISNGRVHRVPIDLHKLTSAVASARQTAEEVHLSNLIDLNADRARRRGL